MRDYPLQQRTLGRLLAAKAAENGTRTFLTFGGRTITYVDMEAATNSAGNGLRALGVTKGTHVALMLANHPEFLFVAWGAAKIGAVVVPLNTAAKGEQLRYFLDQSDTTAIVVEAEFAGRIAEVLDGLLNIKLIVHMGAPGRLAGARRSLIPLEAVLAGDSGMPPVDAATFSDPAYIIYTSGTTGPSKGVVSPHAQGINVGRQVANVYGYGADDVLYACLPLFHVNALWYSVMAAMWANAQIALAPRFSASQFWNDIRRTGATQFNALGVMAAVLMKEPPSETDRDHKVRQAMLVPLSQNMFSEFGARFGLKVCSVFAATETFPVTAFTVDDPPARGASAGHPHGYAEVSIVDDLDQPLPVGEVGEILVRPCEPWSGMTGYYKMAEATVAANANLWFHTGDRGRLDVDGFLWFVDRKKETIRRRGENISAYEVEMLLAKHPDVVEVAAIPVAADISEDDLMVYVVKKPSAALDEPTLVRFAADTMSYFMVPRYVAFIDALPKTASEKIEKYKLRQMAEADRAALWDREAAGIRLAR